MNVYKTADGSVSGLYALLADRATRTGAGITEKVASVLEDVRTRGDDALYDYCERFDGFRPDRLEMTADEIRERIGQVSADMYGTLERAAANIRAYHEKQLSAG